MAKKGVDLAALAEGRMFSAEDVEAMRGERAVRVSMEHQWCGRVRSTTKLRLTYTMKFGSKIITVDVVASMRTGKREVRFDKMVVLAAGKYSPLNFEFDIPGHALRVEEVSTGQDYRFALRIDGVRFHELADVHGHQTDADDSTLSREILAAKAEHSGTSSSAQRKKDRADKKSRYPRNDEDDDDDNHSEEPTKRSTTIVAENALVALYQVQLEPGVFGTGILLRNEPSASRRIEVAAVSRAARVPGVVVGDVLVAINGKPLPRGASATELQELVRSNPRYALTAVDALMWHKKSIRHVDDGVPEAKEMDDDPKDDDAEDIFFEEEEQKAGLAGSELTINCGNGALGVEWARMVATKTVDAPHINGLFAAVGIRGQAVNLAVKPGDLLVGINHEPLPRDLPSATLLQRFSSAAARGPPTLNLWRCYDSLVLDTILDQCASAKKHALAVNPSVSAHVPRRPRDLTEKKSSCC